MTESPTENLSRSITGGLAVHHLSKSFPGVRALESVELEVQPGEVLAVIGENGAGKSTLMKILAGVQRPDTGTITLDGQAVEFRDTRSAMDAGIALIHQELNLCPNLNVGENLFLGNEPRRFGWIDYRELYRESERFLNRVGLSVSPRTALSRLSIGQQQMVEIAKALSIRAKYLIFDEPTSSLSAAEAEALFRLIDQLKAQNVGIIYISHRLGEVSRLADRVTVLRDGRNAGHLAKQDIHHANMVQLMIGRDISKFYGRRSHDQGEVILQAQGLRTRMWPDHAVDLEVRRGELLGIAGLVGAGRSELLRAMFGADPLADGRIRIGSHTLGGGHGPGQAIACGMGFVPEDRKSEGLLLDFSVQKNIGLAGLGRFSRLSGWLNFRQEREDASEARQAMQIKTPSLQQAVKFLSGGNQQKVVIGKWLALKPDVLLVDEPTRGVDIGAKQEIYQLMEKLVADGKAVIFVSSEMEEIIGVADRVLVMHEGRLAGELVGDQMTEENIMSLATGASICQGS